MFIEIFVGPYKCDIPAIRRFVDKYLPISLLDTDLNLIYVNVSHDPLHSANFKILVPRCLQRDVIKLFHCPPSGGHFGARKTLAKIYHLFSWPRASKMTANFVKSCALCQQHKSRHSRMLGKICSAPLTHPFSTLAVDFKGPLPRSTSGMRYLLVVVDTMSGWLECFPLRSANTKNLVTKLVNEVFSRYGVPHSIVSDNGSQFVARVTKEIYARFRIKPSVTSLYHPQANYAEVLNKKLGRLIATYIDDNQRNWDVNLPQFVLSLNSSINSVTNRTPAELVFGRQLNLPMNPVLPTTVEEPLPLYASNLVSRLRRAIEKSQRAREAHRLHTAGKLNENRTDFEYNVGDKVWLKAHYQSDKSNYFSYKLAPKFVGPMEIIEKVSPVVYRLKDLRDNSIQRGYQHFNNLKPLISET